MSHSKPRILVADDDAGILRAVERVLSGDYFVTTTHSPADAISLASTIRPKFVICDITMPGIDGFQVMDQIKVADATIDFIPMTGMAEPDTALVEAIRRQAYYFLAKPFERDVLRALVSRRMESRRLIQAEQIHRQRVDREIANARALQKSLMKPGKLTLSNIELAACVEPCSELAGDFYDYARTGNWLAIVICDVVGHGVSAAMLTAVVIAAFRSTTTDQYNPLLVVEGVHRLLNALPSDYFLTMVCARLDLTSGRLEYVNAGHPRPLLRAADGAVRTLAEGGPLVTSQFPPDVWSIAVDQLNPGESLLLYTDGVNEADSTLPVDRALAACRFDHAAPPQELSHSMFGETRLIEIVSTHDGSAVELLDKVSHAVKAHISPRLPHDDMTLVVVNCR